MTTYPPMHFLKSSFCQHMQRIILLLALTIVALTIVALPPAQAQTPPNIYMGSEQQPVRVRTGAVYQQYADQDRRLSQLSFPVSAFIPMTRNLALSLFTNPAMVSGESITSLEGLSDSQVALSYHQEVGDGSIVISFGSNVPSGKRELTEAEFATTALISQDFYGFFVPVFGQGLNLSPGLTFAYPLGENMVAGFGFAYQLKGSYKPVANMPESFTPGDEMMITGGLDFKVGASWALSTNVSYVLYQADELGATPVFESGDQTLISVQLLGSTGASQTRVLARYRTKARSQLPAGDLMIVAPRTVPEQFQLVGSHTLTIQENLRASLIARLRHYQETSFFSDKMLFDLGASPEVAFSETVSAAMRFVYTFGSFPGVEIGGGLAFTIQ